MVKTGRNTPMNLATLVKKGKSWTSINKTNREDFTCPLAKKQMLKFLPVIFYYELPALHPTGHT